MLVLLNDKLFYVKWAPRILQWGAEWWKEQLNLRLYITFEFLLNCIYWL